MDAGSGFSLVFKESCCLFLLFIQSIVQDHCSFTDVVFPLADGFNSNDSFGSADDHFILWLPCMVACGPAVESRSRSICSWLAASILVHCPFSAGGLFGPHPMSCYFLAPFVKAQSGQQPPCGYGWFSPGSSCSCFLFFLFLLIPSPSLQLSKWSGKTDIIADCQVFGH